MSLEQTRFLGASVRAVNTSLGWNGEQSRLVVSLVEDVNNGDVFTYPEVGTRVNFTLGNLNFQGIIKKWTKSNNTSENPGFEVECSDARNLLNDTQLILDTYNGTTAGIPNLINVYGYWENGLGFGGSQVNETGMPWRQIQSAITTLTNLPDYPVFASGILFANGVYSPTGVYFGGPVTFKNSKYSLDLTELPNVPNYFRIPGPHQSISDFINIICEYGGHDYYLQQQGTNLKIKTVNRINQPALETIASIVNDSSKNKASYNNGLELRDEITAAFLVGGPVNVLYKSASIETFWGFDVNLSPIIGVAKQMHLYNEFSDYIGSVPVHEANLNASPVADILGQVYYPCTTYEMRAALLGQQSWTEFVSRFRPNDIGQLMQVPTLGQATARGNTQLPNDRIAANLANVANLNRIASASDKGPTNFDKVKRMYDFVLFYAKNYMGRKYACRLPFVDYKTDSETLQTTYSYEPADAGFVDPNRIVLAGNTYGFDNDLDFLPPIYSDLFQSQDSRYVPFVSYVDVTKADFSKLDVSSTIIDKNNPLGSGVLFAKCQVDPKLIFIPGSYSQVILGSGQNAVAVPAGQTFIQPAAVITTNPIYELPTNVNGGYKLDYMVYGGTSAQIGGTGSAPSTVRLNDIDFPTRIPFRISSTAGSSALRALSGRRDYVIYNNGGALPGNGLWKSANINVVVTPTISFTLVVNIFYDNGTWRCQLDYGADGFANPQDVPKDPNNRISFNPIEGRFRYSFPTGTFNNVLGNNPDDDGSGLINIYIGAGALNPHRRTMGGNIPSNMAPAPIPVTHAHIPLRSNILTYGPWYAGTNQGKVRIETDNSMVPWNYGGYPFMNLAGRAKVESMITNATQIESGQLTIEGAPSCSLGESLVSGGPNVTRLNISYSDKGVTTTYFFETFVPRFGHLGKYLSDRLSRQAQIQNHLIRDSKQKFRQSLIRQDVFSSAARGALANQEDSSLLLRNSPHTVFFAQNDIDYINGEPIIRPMISLSKLDEALVGVNSDDGGDFSSSAIVDLSALVRPISIFGSGQNMSVLNQPTGTWKDNGLNAYRLNPLYIHASGQDFDIISYGQSYEGVHHYRENIGQSGIEKNFIALRGPLVITGHGYDISGNYLPGDNWLTRSDLWKTGPIDTLWDDNRKVWTVHDIKIGKTIETIPAATSSSFGSGYMSIWKNNVDTHQYMLCYNWFSSAISSGLKISSHFVADENKWIYGGADCV